MATITLKKPSKQPQPAPKNLAELMERLGNVPLERIRCAPAPGTATEEDMLRLLESADKHICELIDGVLVEKTVGIKESHITFVLGYFLMAYLVENDLGFAFTTDGPIRVKPGRIRFPDTGFVSWKRLPNEEFPKEKILDVMPDLGVEVLSESNTEKEMELKLDDYFQAGMKLVWFIDPETETVTVYTSRHKKKVLTNDQSLDGGKVLPGFSLPIEKLFSHIHRGEPK